MNTEAIETVPDAPAPILAAASVISPEQTNPASTLPAWAPPAPTLPDFEDAPPVDPRSLSLEEQMLRADAPAARPSDYRIVSHPDHEASPEALAEIEGLQSLLYSARLPAEEGAGLIEAIKSEMTRNAEPLSDAQFDHLVQSTEYTLKRQLGEDEFTQRQTKLSALMVDINRQTGGKLADYIEAHAHVLLQPLVYSRLLAHAARLDARKRA